MKTKKIITIALLAIFCVTQFSCKKDKVETPAPVVKKYLPTAILLQNTATAATETSVTLTYNANNSIASMSQTSSSSTRNWTLSYNTNGTLNTANYSGGSTNNIYSLTYGANNKVNTITKTGSSPAVLNLNYLAGSNT